MMKQIVQDFSDNRREVAGLNLEQPIYIDVNIMVSDEEKLDQVLTSMTFRTCELISEMVTVTV